MKAVSTINLGKFLLSTNLSFNQSPTEGNINELQNKIWYIIKPESNNLNSNQNPLIANENESFELKINDIIKLGRVKYAITEVSLGGVLHTIDNNQTRPVFDLIHEYNPKVIDPDVVCKVCLFQQNDYNDPMINLCKCSGSMSSHYNCLKQWMFTKLVTKKNLKETVSSYNMKSFNCEVCKMPYPCKCS